MFLYLVDVNNFCGGASKVGLKYQVDSAAHHFVAAAAYFDYISRTGEQIPTAVVSQSMAPYAEGQV